MSAPQARCPWCGAPNTGPTLLCAECEAEAVRFRQAYGLAVRRVPSVASTPDD